MADIRLYRENVTIALAFPEAFADWQNPTAAELNSALVYNITCALNEDGTTFDLADSDTDDTITFCQAAGSNTVHRSLQRFHTVIAGNNNTEYHFTGTSQLKR